MFDLDEKNERLKESLGKKIEEYLKRAEQLKEVLKENANNAKKPVASGESGGGKAGGK